jgi:hypothetical protein
MGSFRHYLLAERGLALGTVCNHIDGARTAIGRRDYALIMTLLRLGLRRG